MVEKKSRKMRFSEEDLGILKSTFAENEDILIVLRKVMLQVPLTDEDKSVIQGKMSPEVVSVIKKAFLPEIEGGEPLDQVIDLYMTIDLKDRDMQDAYFQICARGKVVDYIRQQLSMFADGGSQVTNIAFASLLPNMSKDAEQMFVDLIARNTIIVHVEQQLNQIKFLAGKKEETPEETAKRLMLDSSK